MAFVPASGTAIAGHLSPRARELSNRLQHEVEQFRRNHPDTSDADIRNAIGAAQSRVGGAARQRQVAAVAAAGVAAAVAAGAASGAFTAARELAPWMGAIGVGAIVLVAIIAFARRT